MRIKLFLSIALTLIIGFSACQSNQKQSDYCTVKGTVKGLPDGTQLELLDAFNQWEVVGTGSVKKGAFEIHPDVSSPTHVFLYEQEENQLAWVNVCDGSGGRKENSKVRQDYALRGYPTTLLIDCQSGEVIARGELKKINAMLSEMLQ